MGKRPGGESLPGRGETLEGKKQPEQHQVAGGRKDVQKDAMLATSSFRSLLRRSATVEKRSDRRSGMRPFWLFGFSLPRQRVAVACWATTTTLCDPRNPVNVVNLLPSHDRDGVNLGRQDSRLVTSLATGWLPTVVYVYTDVAASSFPAMLILHREHGTWSGGRGRANLLRWSILKRHLMTFSFSLIPFDLFPMPDGG